MFCRSKIDGQMHLVTVARRAFLPAIRHDLLAGAVVLDETVTVLSVEIFFHRRFHALDAAMIEIREPDHVAKHRAVGIDARGVVLEVNAAQICRAKFFTQRVCAALAAPRA